MTLLEEIKDYYTGSSYPPDPADLGDGEDVELVVDGKVIDSSPRWGNHVQFVYKRGDELVVVEDVEPATEMQDWGDYGDPTIYEGEAYEVTTTKYRRKSD